MKYPSLRWDLPTGIEGFDVRLEEFAATLGLSVKRSTTKSLSANFHWHLSRAGQRGVLEVTWVFGSGEAWMNVRANRGGEWIEDVVEALLRELSLSAAMRESEADRVLGC